MNLNDAVLLIEGRIGQRTGLDAFIQAEIRQAQQSMEEGEFLPWFLRVNELITVTFQSNPLPVGFLREHEDGFYWQGKALVREDYAALSKEYYGAVGSPRFYALTGLTWQLFPAPDQGYPVAISYYKKDVLPVLPTDTSKWLTFASELICAMAGVKLAKKIRDAGYVQMFEGDRGEALTKLMKASAAQESYPTVIGA